MYWMRRVAFANICSSVLFLFVHLAQVLTVNVVLRHLVPVVRLQLRAGT